MSAAMTLLLTCCGLKTPILVSNASLPMRPLGFAAVPFILFYFQLLLHTNNCLSCRFFGFVCTLLLHRTPFRAILRETLTKETQARDFRVVCGD